MSTLARSMKATVTKDNLKVKLKCATQYLTRLHNLMEEVTVMNIHKLNAPKIINYIPF